MEYGSRESWANLARTQEQTIVELQHELSVSNGLLEELVTKQVKSEQEAQKSADYFRQHGILIGDPQVRGSIVRINKTLETWKQQYRSEEHHAVLTAMKSQEEELDALISKLKSAVVQVRVT